MANRKELLEQSYRNTTYTVFIKNEQYHIKIEQPLPLEIEKWLNDEKSAAILTAWNPRSQKFSSAKNTSRNSELKADFKNQIVFNAVGQGVDEEWPAEDSFFVVGLSKDDAEMFATKYEQYAYIWCEPNQPASLQFTIIWHNDG